MADSFAGQTVVVTGGASGIGKACAGWFASRGARVYVGDITLTPAESLPAGVQERRCDVRFEGEVAGLIGWAADATGRLDVLVYSAGIEVVGQIPDISEADWDRCLDTNFKGAFLAAKHAIPVMARSGGGTIVNIASNAGLLTRYPDPVYSTSKGALIALTKALALCHAKDRVRVNALCPGPVEGTGMMDSDVLAAPDPERRKREVIAASPMAQALGRMSTTAEMAEAVGFLADPGSPFLTGAILAIDGAKSMGVPGNYRAVMDESATDTR
jgi:NAD(P)-dependent dehydrogenase (short-subunit alcohol dehydrogenase family)